MCVPQIVDAIKSYGKVDKFYMVKCCVVSWVAPIVLPVTAFVTSWSMNERIEENTSPYIGNMNEIVYEGAMVYICNRCYNSIL